MKKVILALLLAASAWPAMRVNAQTSAPQKAQNPTSVTITGEVIKPGTYQLLPGETLSELLVRAGGLTATAAPTVTYALREGVVILLAEEPSKFKLREGDVIVVTKKPSRVSVFGAVKAPQAFELSATQTLSVRDAIVRAGGFDVDLDKSVPWILVRRQSSSGKRERTESYILPRDAEVLEASAPLQAGDAVFVWLVPKSIGLKPPAGIQLLNAA